MFISIFSVTNYNTNATEFNRRTQKIVFGRDGGVFENKLLKIIIFFYFINMIYAILAIFTGIHKISHFKDLKSWKN